MGYRVIRFDVSVTTERQQLVNENESYTAFHVLQLPVGAAVELSVGSGDRIPVFAGFWAEFCPPERRGLALRSTVALPGECVVLAWFENSGQSGGPS